MIEYVVAIVFYLCTIISDSTSEFGTIGNTMFVIVCNLEWKNRTNKNS